MAAPPSDPKTATTPVAPESVPSKDEAARRPREIGGPQGPEPTRYGDWERNGRVSDF